MALGKKRHEIVRLSFYFNRHQFDLGFRPSLVAPAPAGPIGALFIIRLSHLAKSV